MGSPWSGWDGENTPRLRVSGWRSQHLKVFNGSMNIGGAERVTEAAGCSRGRHGFAPLCERRRRRRSTEKVLQEMLWDPWRRGNLKPAHACDAQIDTGLSQEAMARGLLRRVGTFAPRHHPRFPRSDAFIALFCRDKRGTETLERDSIDYLPKLEPCVGQRAGGPRRGRDIAAAGVR